MPLLTSLFIYLDPLLGASVVVCERQKLSLRGFLIVVILSFALYGSIVLGRGRQPRIMASSAAQEVDPATTTLQTFLKAQEATTSSMDGIPTHHWIPVRTSGRTVYITDDGSFTIQRGLGSTGKGILIGMLSAFGSAMIVAISLALVYFFRYTQRGRILLDRMGRPGEYDDEQAFAREEADALETMDDMSKSEYLRAKGEDDPKDCAELC